MKIVQLLYKALLDWPGKQLIRQKEHGFVFLLL